MRKAFTLIEIMVATMLLAMVVTVLTMVFNQSSIAWSTGLAAVTGLDQAREDICIFTQEAENAILSDDGNRALRIVSVFDDTTGRLRTGDYRTLSQTFERASPTRAQMRDPGDGSSPSITGSQALGHDSFIVGVVSYGPDGKTGGDNSWDDISTLPEEIVK